MDEIVIVESHDYAQVVFDEIKDCFVENQPLECHFSINELLKADPSDSIGIFKVGFVNHKDFYCSAQVDLGAIKGNKGTITFKAEDLPKDDGEFYQFVYVSHSKQIRGASIPFQFRRTHLSDLVEVEDQESVVIKTKESAINDTITEIKSRCAHLSHANETYEKLIKENEDLIQVLKEEVSAIKLRCFRLTMDNEKLNHALRTKTDNLKNLADTITSLTNDQANLQNKFDDLTSENKNLMESLQVRIDQVAQLKSDLETVKMNQGELENILSLKETELSQLKRDKDELNRIAGDLNHINDKIVSLEKQVDERVDELTKIKNDLKNNEQLVAEQTTTIQAILMERDDLNNLIQKLSKEKNDLACNKENLAQELNMSRDKLQASEQCKEMLRAQLLALTDELKESNNKNEQITTQIKDLIEKEKQFQAEKLELSQKINAFKTEFHSKMEESAGSYYALKLAHVHLENKLKAMEKSKANSDKDLDAYKQMVEHLKAENEELKDRLKAGNKEYTKLLEKYRLVKNQQFNHDMNIYHDLNGDVIGIRKDFNYKHNNTNTSSQRIFMNERQHQLNYRHSTPACEQDSENDSAIQAKTNTASHSGRVSSADIENTLLDALLGSSFPWHDESSKIGKDLNVKHNLCAMGMNASSPFEDSNEIQPTKITTTTKQPTGSKMQSHTTSDLLSDDGLIHFNENNKQCVSEKEKNNAISSNTNMKFDQDEDNVFNDVAPLSTYDKLVENKRNMYNNSNSKNPIDVSNIRSCDICSYIFPTDSDINEIENHYTIHYGPSCPVCFMLFRKGYPQNDFEKHVNSHFPNEN